ncbi:hypothetical protein Tco_1003939 [Tanacetum coccineum]|uniref:Uncharacterized protein n=1 Tax=Tanacetum coccineum TaxID=301880 RepID=A0ABQ5FAG9_9ASTR
MIRHEGNLKRYFEERRSSVMNELTFPAIPRSQLKDEPIILEGIIEGNQVQRILVDGGRETYHPLGVIDLRVTLGKEGRSKMVLMEFAIIKCRSPYNIIIGRTGMRSLGLVGSTIYSMIKFPTNQGVVTMETSREALQECKQLERVQGLWKKYVTMGTTLTTNCKQLLVDVLWENREVFAWTESERTTVPRFIMEYQLKIYPLAKPVVHKRRPLASEGRLALKEKVFHWLKEGLIRNVQYPE